MPRKPTNESHKSRRGSRSRPEVVLSDRTGRPLSPGTLKMRRLKKIRCTLNFERTAWGNGSSLVAGVDEVGRGALFGPVVAAAVILDPKVRIRGLRDSKLLPEEQRDKLAVQIRKHAIAISIAVIDHEKIDEINIYWASKLAMEEAVRHLSPVPDHLLVDAMTLNFPCSQDRIIQGDAKSCSIAAASIIAKVERDRMIRALDAQFPGYGLASNKGYGTPSHKAVLRSLGPSFMHRRSFAPVWAAEAAIQETFVFAAAAAAAADR